MTSEVPAPAKRKAASLVVPALVDMEKPVRFENVSEVVEQNVEEEPLRTSSKSDVWEPQRIKYSSLFNCLVILFGSTAIAAPMVLIPLEWKDTGYSTVPYYSSTSFLYYLLCAAMVTIVFFVQYEFAHWSWKLVTLACTCASNAIFGTFAIEAWHGERSHIQWCAVVVLVAGPWFVVPLYLTYLHRKQKREVSLHPLLSYQLWVWQSLWIFNMVLTFFFCQLYASIIWNAVNPRTMLEQYGMLLLFSVCQTPFAELQAVLSHGCEVHTTVHYEFEMLGQFVMHVYFFVMECALFTQIDSMSAFSIYCLSLYAKDVLLFNWGMSEARVHFIVDLLSTYESRLARFLHDRVYLRVVHVKNATVHEIFEAWKLATAPLCLHALHQPHEHRLARHIWPRHLQGMGAQVIKRIHRSERYALEWMRRETVAEEERKECGNDRHVSQYISRADILLVSRRKSSSEATLALLAVACVTIGYLSLTPICRFSRNEKFYADGSNSIDSDINRTSASAAEFWFGMFCALVGLAFAVATLLTEKVLAHRWYSFGKQFDHLLGNVLNVRRFRNNCLLMSAHIIGDLFFFLVDKNKLFKP